MRGRRSLPAAVVLAVIALVAGAGEAAAGARKGGPRVGSCGGFDVPDDPGWREWGELTRQAVQKAWLPPVAARAGHPGIVLVRAHVLADGTIDDVVVVRSRGHESMATAAAAALVEASPLPPLPPAPDGDDTARLTYLFSYNVSEKAACRFRDRHHP